MNKGICFHFGYVYDDIEKQVRDIKEAGFDCVMSNADPRFDKQNGTIKKQVKLLKKYGVKLSSLHMRYLRDELPNFWKDNAIGKRLECNLVKDVKIAKKYGFKCVVVHVKGEASQIGFDRINRVLKLCEKLNVPLALENLSNNTKILEEIFKYFKSDYLKFCLDVGHNHAFTPDVDFIKLYGDKLITLHLHDNLGSKITDEEFEKMGYTNKYKPGEARIYNPDMHTLNKYGNINWKKLAKQLSEINNPLSLDYEVMMAYRKDETPQEVLKEVYKQACELEGIIKK